MEWPAEFISKLPRNTVWMDRPFVGATPILTLVGEAPAREECIMNMPFVGASGLILECALHYAGLSREQCNITNVFPFTLKRDQKPSMSVVDTLAGPILKEKIRDWPRVVVTLGAYALRAFTADDKNLLDKAGLPIEVDDWVVVPTVHPSNVVDALFSDSGEPSIFWYIVMSLNIAKKIAENDGSTVGLFEEVANPLVLTEVSEVEEFLRNSDVVALDFEGTHTNPALSKSPLCVGLATEGSHVVIPFQPWYPDWGIPFSEFLRVLSSSNVRLVMHNLLYDYVLLRLWGYDGPSPICDTMILLHTLFEYLPKSLKFASTFLCGLKPYSFSFSSIDPVIKGKVSFEHAQLPMVQLLQYCGTDAYATLKLYHKLNSLLDERARRVYSTYYHPLLISLTDVTLNGIPMNTQRALRLQEELQQELSALEAEIAQELGIQSVTSPDQLREALKDAIIAHGAAKQTRAGKLSVDVSVLKRLRDAGVEVAGKIIDFRKRGKLLSTYVKSYMNYIDEQGVIHTSFGLTATGRLRSSDPALQTLPRKSPVLQLFTAVPDGEPPYREVFVKADYCAAEYWLLAYFAGLKELLDPKLDIHRMIASFFFEVPYDQVSPELRQTTKNISFGVIYGASPQRVAAILNVGEDKAQELLDKYFEKFPSIRDVYMKTRELQVKTRGFTEVPGVGIRRHFPIELAMFQLSRPTAPSSKYLSDMSRLGYRALSKAFRESYNLSCQGGVAVLTNTALIKLNQELRGQGKVRLQIHDALVITAPQETFVEAVSIMKRIMVSPLLYPDLVIPVEMHVGWDLLNMVEIMGAADSVLDTIDWNRVLEKVSQDEQIYAFIQGALNDDLRSAGNM